MSVQPVADREAAIKAHFSKPQVQYIGSTSGCGCDFPHVLFEAGEWPYFEPEDEEEDEEDRKRIETERLNCKKLVALLQSIGEAGIELYGVWDGNFAEVPKAEETISAATILASDFRFREQVLYRVRLHQS